MLTKTGRRTCDALPVREAKKMAASQQQASATSSTASVSGPGSAGGSGPQQQPQPPAQLVGPAQSGLLQQQQQDFDPVQRYKMLIPQLKESLQKEQRWTHSAL
uniref:Mediator of RNA polymerase II transcription subunit 29 n=1 Tax=Capra hircus TaxID=9925 RepID=A0A452FQX1_CAPHI